MEKCSPQTDLVSKKLVAAGDIFLQILLPFKLLHKIMGVTCTTPYVMRWVTLTYFDCPFYLEAHKKNSDVVLVEQQDYRTHL